MDEFADRYGRYAVIAGASEGVGACFARALVEKGLDLVFISRSEAKLAPLADEIRTRSGRNVRYMALDLSDAAGKSAMANGRSLIADISTILWMFGRSMISSRLAPASQFAIRTILLATH